MQQKSPRRHSLKLKGNPWKHRGTWRWAFGSGVWKDEEIESPGEEEAAVNTLLRGKKIYEIHDDTNTQRQPATFQLQKWNHAFSMLNILQHRFLRLHFTDGP